MDTQEPREREPEIVVTDPRFESGHEQTWFEQLAMRFMKDERDLPFAHLIVSMTVVLLPAAGVLFATDLLQPWGSTASLLAATAYLAVLYLVFVDRYILMLHCTSHRPCFKFKYRWMNRWIVWVLGPLCGETPETYYAHHMGMHHAEGNLPDDLSSTMKYRRDSAAHFARYFLRFFFGSLVELGYYHYSRNRKLLLRRMLTGELSFFLAVGLLAAFVNTAATVIVFVVPLVTTRFLMMAGNWSQHAFIDPAEPGNDYKSSIVCINTRYNRRCFNDGYHVGHHVKANRHWTEMPDDFLRNLPRYAAEDSVVFEGIDYFQIWVMLMLRRYDMLASHFVDLSPWRGEPPRSREEIITFLRSRTRAIPSTPRTA